MWKRILTEASNLLPDFNDYLLKEFRREKINQIKFYLDDLFKESAKKLPPQVRYIGFKVLTPEERIQCIRTNKILKKRVSILKSTFETVRYEYIFQGNPYYVYVDVPYMVDDHIMMANTHYWPILYEIEPGGLNHAHNEIILKVMCAPIMLYRSATFTIITDKGKVFNETVNQCKIHQGRRGRGKNACMVPIILYHLVRMPFYQCMAYYGFQPGEIQIVDHYQKEEDFSYIKIKDNIYLRVKDTVLDNKDDKYKRRVIASYLMCLNEWSQFGIRDLVSSSPGYYRVILGKYTYSQIKGADSDKAVMYAENAGKHLATTDTVLDEPARAQLKGIGIDANDIYDFLYIAFYNMDKWLVNYSPCDLYNKKIGSLEKTLSPLVSRINRTLFDLVNTKKPELKPDNVKKAISRCSQMENWITASKFRANPSFCNDNKLITILAKRERSFENTEIASNKTTKKAAKMKSSQLKAHPSHLVVESILALTESKPIMAGEINYYLKIDTNGQIIKPDWAHELDHVFD